MKFTAFRFFLAVVVFALVFGVTVEANVFALEKRDINPQDSADIRDAQPEDDEDSDMRLRGDEMEDDEDSVIRRKDDESEDSDIDENNRHEEEKDIDENNRHEEEEDL